MDNKFETPSIYVQQKAKCNNYQKLCHFARVCRSKQNKSHQRRINYVEGASSEEEESETAEIRHITQINKIIPDNNYDHYDHYGVEIKINGEKQKFIIDTGSPVTIVPYDQRIHDTKEIKLMKRTYQDVNKNEIKLMGENMGNRRIQQTINQTINADHQKKRHHTNTGSKLFKTTANNNTQNFIGQHNRPIRKHIQEVPQTLHHQPHNKNRRSQNTIKTVMLSKTTKSTTITLPLTRRRKKRTEPINRIRTYGELKIIKEDCFVSLVRVTVKRTNPSKLL